jgi:hypothetical protein
MIAGHARRVVTKCFVNTADVQALPPVDTFFYNLGSTIG